MNLELETIANLISLISQFLTERVDEQCNCAFGEYLEAYIGSVSWEENQARGFLANRDKHLGFVLVTEVNDYIRARGREIPFTENSEFYYRFYEKSQYSVGIFSGTHGWAVGETSQITSARHWVPARCAQNAIVIYPAPGHTIHCYAVYLMPTRQCFGGNGSNGNGSSNGNGNGNPLGPGGGFI